MKTREPYHTAGDRVGPYSLELLLGQGASAEVWLVNETGELGFTKRQALKLLRPPPGDIEGQKKALINEARVCGRLKHRSLVDVYRVGEHEGELYIAMEFIDGPDLNTLLVALRRRKVDVLRELPEKLRDEITVSIDSATRRACNAAARSLAAAGVSLDELTQEALSARQGASFEYLATAARALATAKLPALLDLLDLWEQESSEPRLVWSRHVAPLQALAQREGWEAITGATLQGRREELVRRCQRGELRGLALSIGAAGTAITLTAASHSIYLDRAWTPGDNIQSEDRTHRIGQRRACRYTLLVADHELDRALARLLHDKAATITSTIDAAARI